MLYLFQKMLSLLLVILGFFGLTGKYPKNIMSYTPRELERLDAYKSSSRNPVSWRVPIENRRIAISEKTEG